jgi:hypothetical protein
MKKKSPKVTGGGLSASEIARLSDLSTSRVYCLLSEGRSAFEILLSAQRRKQQAAGREVPVLPIDVDIAAPVNGGVPAYSESLARKEAALAELRNVQLMEKRGELVPTQYVKLFASRILVETRDELWRASSELADTLAAEDNPVRVAELLRGVHERALDRLARLDRIWGPPEPPPPEAA